MNRLCTPCSFAGTTGGGTAALLLQRERPWATGAAPVEEVERHLRALLSALQAPAQLSLQPHVRVPWPAFLARLALSHSSR